MGMGIWAGRMSPQARCHILTRLLFVLTVISAPLYFMLPGLSSAQWLITPGAAVLSGIVWAIVASGAYRSVCTMKLLVHQPCAKHPKAARWPWFGYHGTLAVQSLYSHRIRCPYCGTPNLLVGTSDTASR